MAIYSVEEPYFSGRRLYLERRLSGLKVAYAITLLAVLCFGVITIIPTIQPVLAVGTIHIRPDGSIDPSDAPVQRDGDLYTLTGDITCDGDGIIVERSNMTLDGTGHSLQGSRAGNGVGSFGKINVTIMNMVIKDFQIGAYLQGFQPDPGLMNYSTFNRVLRNTFAGNNQGIYIDLYSHHNTISYNSVSNSTHGIWIETWPYYTTISGNVVSSCTYAIDVGGSQYNIVSNNTVSNSTNGIILSGSFRTSIDGNNITETRNGDAVKLDDSSYNNVTANIITNYVTPSAGTGIALIVGAHDNKVHGNTVDGRFGRGLLIDYSDGSYNDVYQNRIVNTAGVGVKIDGHFWSDGKYSRNNTIRENNVTGGMQLYHSTMSLIYRNNIELAGIGIDLRNFNSSTISDNTISRADYALQVSSSYDNKFYHNNIINNTHYVPDAASGLGSWDGGYPLGGNYWNNYNGTDAFHGPNQDIPGSDGIGDTQYVIGSGNVDRYPLMQPYPPPEGSHDIQLVSLSILKAIIGQGFELFGLITVFNNGIAPEGIDFLANANNVELWNPMGIGYLPSGTQADFAIDVNTSVCEKGNNTITVYVEPVVGETDLLDNTLIQWLIVSIIGDVNGPTGWPDSKVDIRDLAAIAKIYGINYPDPKYNVNYDLTGFTPGVPDGKIDVKDLALAAKNFGMTDP